jgi:hypothetical protein
MSDKDRQTVMDAAAAQQRRREMLARAIWAEAAGLVMDPLGEQLPDRLWQQALSKADAILALIGARPIARYED